MFNYRCVGCVHYGEYKDMGFTLKVCLRFKDLLLAVEEV